MSQGQEVSLSRENGPPSQGHHEISLSHRLVQFVLCELKILTELEAGDDELLDFREHPEHTSKPLASF